MRKFFRTIWRILTAPFRWFGGLVINIRNFFSEEPEDAPLPDALAKTVQDPMGVLYHLNILRKHLTRGLIFIVLTTALSFTFIDQIMDFLIQPLPEAQRGLIAIDPTEPVGTVMRAALLSGVTLGFPYLALEAWLFIGPGVSRRARFFGLIAIPIAFLFFVGGMAFAYYVILPAGLPFLINFGGFEPQMRASSYFRFISSLLFWIGVFFEFPLVVYLLASLGMVQARALANQWRLAIVIIAIIAAMITPTIDPVNMALVMGPMSVLFFLSIGLAYIAQAGRARRQRKQETQASGI